MLGSKDFEYCIKGLMSIEQTDEVKRIIRKLELVIQAEDIKKTSEDAMMEVNQELRKIFEEENKVGE